MRNDYLEEDVQELSRENFTIFPICTVFIISSNYILYMYYNKTNWSQKITLRSKYIYLISVPCTLRLDKSYLK